MTAIVYRKGAHGYGYANRDHPCPVCGKYGTEVTYNNGHEIYGPHETICDNCGCSTYDEFAMSNWSAAEVDRYLAGLRFAIHYPRLYSWYTNLRWYWLYRLRQWWKYHKRTSKPTRF